MRGTLTAGQPQEAWADASRPEWGLWVSVVLHAVLLAAILLSATGVSPTAPFDEGVPVEIWTPQEVEGLTRERPADNPTLPSPVPPQAGAGQPAIEPPGPPVPDPKPGTGSGQAEAPTMRHAQRILSGAVLSDPRSKEARALLPLLEDGTRLEQICDIEAMAQIAALARGFQPDRVVAYARAATRTQGRVIVASGAAFRSKRLWYELSFRCRIAPDRQEIQAFDFEIGRAIPKAAWEEYGLPARY